MWSRLGSLSTRALSSLARAPVLPAWSPSSCRSIITVSTYSPSPHSHPSDYRNEVRRNEDIAIAKFNRMMRTEIAQGTMKAAGRRGKRYARFVKPHIRERTEERAESWRYYKQRMASYVNWIQYRRRKELP